MHFIHYASAEYNGKDCGTSFLGLEVFIILTYPSPIICSKEPLIVQRVF